MPLRGQPSSLNITCNTNISSDDPTVRYNWVFRGVPVDSNSPNFYTNGNTLLITTADIWDVIGTFQCFVVNMAGSMTTNIQLLIDGTAVYNYLILLLVFKFLVACMLASFPVLYHSYFHLQYD